MSLLISAISQAVFSWVHSNVVRDSMLPPRAKSLGRGGFLPSSFICTPFIVPFCYVHSESKTNCENIVRWSKKNTKTGSCPLFPAPACIITP